MRYSSNDVKENKEIYDLYVQKYLEDIRSFGEATAIYQRRNDKLLEKGSHEDQFFLCRHVLQEL